MFYQLNHNKMIDDIFKTAGAILAILFIIVLVIVVTPILIGSIFAALLIFAIFLMGWGTMLYVKDLFKRRKNGRKQ